MIQSLDDDGKDSQIDGSTTAMYCKFQLTDPLTNVTTDSVHASEFPAT